jgi:hypothetical protein
MNKHSVVHSLVTFGCLVAAIGFYGAGATSTAAFLVLGVVFEGAFWMRLLRRKQP